MNPQLEKLLQFCTVKLSIPDKTGWGTGFFVAPGLILTCYHVVKDAKNDIVQVCRQNQEDFAEAVIERSIPNFDLALLQFSSPVADLACVYLDESFQADDSLYTYGYPDDFSQGAPVTTKCEGMTGGDLPLIKFKAGQIRPGLSGSPLLNLRTGKVCGIVKFTRDRSFALGGGAVPTREIFTQFPQLMESQQGFHQQDNRWTKLLPPSLSQTHLSRKEYRHRQALLNKVKHAWIEGVLEKSLHNQVLIELGLEKRPDTLAQPWNMVLQTSDEEAAPLPQGTKVIDLFDEIGVGRTLLILGEPGSGKTTTLLELTRDLIARAEQNVDCPIPVVFNLSSWAVKNQKFEDWLVEELNQQYKVPQQIAKTLVKKDQLLLLLDGLDEIRAEYQKKSILILNQFNQNSYTEIVVCSRIKDYKRLPERLNFQSAVYLRLLTPEQVHHYLDSLGFEVMGLKTLIEEDNTLLGLARSPLMLNIIVLTYRGMAAEDLPRTNVREERRKQLFDDYIKRMLNYERIFGHQFASTDKQQYSKTKTICWLRWLALRMVQESQTLFLIEKIQPTWLQTNLQKVVYVLGITTNIILAFGFINTLSKPYALESGIFNDEFKSSFFYIILMSIYGSYSLIMIWNLIFKKTLTRLPKNKTIINRIFSNKFIVNKNFDHIKNILILHYKIAIRNFIVPEIELVESVKWSFNNMIKTFKDILISCIFLVIISGICYLLIILVINLISIVDSILASDLNLIILCLFLLIKILLFLPVIVLSLMLVISVVFIVASPVFLVLNGISIKTEVEKTIITNQGIWNSLKNTMTFSFLGAIIGIIAAITWQFAYQDSPNQLLALLRYYVPNNALWLGFVSLGACNKHFILRVILYFKGYIPWNYARFLNYASERIFLRKVGGGYIFIHRMLMEHFAQMELENRSIQITAKTPNNNR